jgi:hypothetical protein
LKSKEKSNEKSLENVDTQLDVVTPIPTEEVSSKKEVESETEVVSKVGDKQYHNPSDIETIANQATLLAKANEMLESFKGDIEKHAETMSEKDALLNKANEKIQELQGTISNFEKEKEDLKVKIKSEVMTKEIQDTIELTNDLKKKKIAEAQKEADEIIAQARVEAAEIKTELDKEVQIAEERMNKANQTYIEVVEKLKGFHSSIEDILHERKTALPESTPEVEDEAETISVEETSTESLPVMTELPDGWGDVLTSDKVAEQPLSPKTTYTKNSDKKSEAQIALEETLNNLK